ncbi:unnamed protein product, partial [Iphiclides podalirius]
MGQSRCAWRVSHARVFSKPRTVESAVCPITNGAAKTLGLRKENLSAHWPGEASKLSQYVRPELFNSLSHETWPAKMPLRRSSGKRNYDVLRSTSKLHLPFLASVCGFRTEWGESKSAASPNFPEKIPPGNQSRFIVNRANRVLGGMLGDSFDGGEAARMQTQTPAGSGRANKMNLPRGWRWKIGNVILALF